MRRTVGMLALVVAGALPGCVAPSRVSHRVYSVQQPIQGTDGQPLVIKDADLHACDIKADRGATAVYVSDRNRWTMLMGGLGAIGGAIAAIADGATDRNPDGPETDAQRAHRDKTYEDELRICLKGRGYPIYAPEWDPARSTKP